VFVICTNHIPDSNVDVVYFMNFDGKQCSMPFSWRNVHDYALHIAIVMICILLGTFSSVSETSNSTHNRSLIFKYESFQAISCVGTDRMFGLPSESQYSLTSVLFVYCLIMCHSLYMKRHLCIVLIENLPFMQF